jgi:hypothetical protein
LQVQPNHQQQYDTLLPLLQQQSESQPLIHVIDPRIRQANDNSKGGILRVIGPARKNKNCQL